MGILQTLSNILPTRKVEAQYSPAIMDSSYGYGSFNTGSTYGYNTSGIDRNFALQVASVSRCRNLIAGVISGIDGNLLIVVKENMIKLLLTTPEEDQAKNSCQLSTTTIRSSRGGEYAVCQGGVWFIDTD